jgi:uncharacterized protein DUF1876
MGYKDFEPVDKRWAVTITINEDGDATRAKARLWGRWGKNLVGVGVASPEHADRNPAVIGDELAVGRALSDLSTQLLATAASDIETTKSVTMQR